MWRASLGAEFDRCRFARRSGVARIQQGSRSDATSKIGRRRSVSADADVRVRAANRGECDAGWKIVVKRAKTKTIVVTGGGRGAGRQE